MNIRAVLEELGYSLRDDGEFYRSAALYRGGDNPTAMSISKKTGMVFDFAENTRFSLSDLVRQTFNISSKKAEEWLEGKSGEEYVSVEKPKVSLPSIYPKAMLNKLEKDYSFYQSDRNKTYLSDETLRTFNGGVAKSGKMKGRFVFPCFNRYGEISGWAGRDISGNLFMKWKVVGPKKEFVHPIHINGEEVDKESEVILVESLGDLLSLWEGGIKTGLCTFGLDLSQNLISEIIARNPSSVLISLNADSRGQTGAKKMFKILGQLFDRGVVRIEPPTKNDFGVMNKDEIQNWKTELKNKR